MRVLGFSKLWPKLSTSEFTTFRSPRKDKDWQRKEKVTVVLRPRNPNRQMLGVAKIIRKEPKFFFYMPGGLFEERIITDKEARRDGFKDSHEMYLEMVKMHGEKKVEGQFNKLTLQWINRKIPVALRSE